MNLDEAIALSKLSCPAPAPAGDALRVLVQELDAANEKVKSLHDIVFLLCNERRMLLDTINARADTEQAQYWRDLAVRMRELLGEIKASREAGR